MKRKNYEAFLKAVTSFIETTEQYFLARCPAMLAPIPMGRQRSGK
jgi:hypothetical protein